jgi:hypothetical protein
MTSHEKVRSRLENIKEAIRDLISRIDELLDKDDKIEIATVKGDAFTQDLHRLMRDTASVANPVLEEIGLREESIEDDINEYVRVLADNQQGLYFTSINVDAKYSRNHRVLVNVRTWLERLSKAIEKIEDYLDTEKEQKELAGLFAMLDAAKLPLKTRESLKAEFLRVLNELDKCPKNTPAKRE